jgi:predicted phosphodiesterase
MKVGIISDIHGNLEALEAVLRDMDQEGCATAYCLGDVVGYGPEPNEVCARLRDLGIATIQGNHDEAVGSDTPLHEARLNLLAYKSLLWTRKVLLPEHRQWLRQLPHRLHVPELDAGLYHASPLHPEQWEYITSRFQAEDVLLKQTERTCFIGHTHQPFVCVLTDGMVQEEKTETITMTAAGRYLINVGSVGQPRNHDPRCSYVLADTKTHTVTFRKIAYPVSLTQKRIREQNLPVQLADRLALGR